MSAHEIVTTRPLAMEIVPLLARLHQAEAAAMPIGSAWEGCRSGLGASDIKDTQQSEISQYEVTVTFRVTVDRLEELVGQNMNDPHCLDVRVLPARRRLAIGER
ncbi:MAG TPA: hypothetical protein VMT89_07565 [Candidatus Acidoferrales bacterium]|nr:hypothetical protein [Candidatus Acidoferrales bacterium]